MAEPDEATVKAQVQLASLVTDSLFGMVLDIVQRQKLTEASCGGSIDTVIRLVLAYMAADTQQQLPQLKQYSRTKTSNNNKCPRAACL